MKPRPKRFLETTLSVGIWIALGLSLHLSVPAYLLTGIPITAGFQSFVRREPLRALWLRDAPRFQLGAKDWLLALLLLAVPCYKLLLDFGHAGTIPLKLYDFAVLGGVVAAAWCLRNLRRSDLRPLLLCMAFAGGIGVLLVAGIAFAAGFSHLSLHGRLVTGASNFLILVPAFMVVEEVSFRGAFDTHLHHKNESRGFLSALFVSALWGLWHLPIAIGRAPLAFVVPELLVFHCLIGVPLSLYWRRSGNLFVTVFPHALIDAIRNALLELPF
jgi:membrane protease YdiL (CAAX protease family)